MKCYILATTLFQNQRRSQRREDAARARELGLGDRVASANARIRTKKQHARNAVAFEREDPERQKKTQKKAHTILVDKKRAKRNEATLTGLEPATLGRITRSALKIERELISSQSP